MEHEKYFSPQTHKLGCHKTVKYNTDQLHLLSQLDFDVLLVLKGKQRKSNSISDDLLWLSAEQSTYSMWRRQPSYLLCCSGKSRREQTIKPQRAL